MTSSTRIFFGGSRVGNVGDGLEFLNNTGEGMEESEQRDEARTSVDCDDDSHNVRPVVTKSGEVY